MKRILICWVTFSLFALSVVAQDKGIRIADTLTAQEKVSRNTVLLKSELDSLVRLYHVSESKTGLQEPVIRTLAATVRRGSSGPAVKAVQDQANFRNLRVRARQRSRWTASSRPRPTAGSAASSPASPSRSPGFRSTASSARGPGKS